MIERNIFISKGIENYNTLIEDIKAIGHIPVTELDINNYQEKNKISLFLLDIDNIRIAENLSIPFILFNNNADLNINNYNSELLPDFIILSSYPTQIELKNNIDYLISNYEMRSRIDNNESWFKSILHTTTDGIIAIDSNANIKFMNPIAQQMVGVEESNAAGRPASRIIRFKNPEELNIFDLNFLCYKDNNYFEGELYNAITKIYNHVSGNISSVRDNAGNFAGKVFTIKDIGVIKSLFNRVKYQSSHDTLTGLINRKRFIENAEELITLSKFDCSVHGYLVIGLDKFKVINDTCGHIAGDELLRKVSYILQEIDPDNDFIKGRIGGDEFGILFKNRTLSEIKHFTKSIKRKLSKQEFIWGEKEFPIKCSFGIVLIDDKTLDHHALLAAADDACAIAKEKGGNRIEIYNNVVDEYNKRRGEMLWIHRLKDAISKNQLSLYYQLIQPVKSEEYKKIEILIRLKDDSGIIISPCDFIPPAERYGLMPDIDKLVIEESVKACKRLIENKKIKEKYIFCINISGTSIPDKSLPGYILSVFQKYKVPPTLFCFEITETATIKNLDMARSFINNLKRIGCTFSLDDFGSGFSNFTYLRSLNVDILKIDGSFIEELLEDPINRAMVESINNIGHIMKMKTVAEFVKSEEIKNELINIGVDYLQGYNICKPTPLENLLSC